MPQRNDWGDMHTRSAWSGAHLSARQGKFRRARRQLKSSWIQLRYDGLTRELVAATVDRCEFMCRGVEPRVDAPDVAQDLIGVCLKQRSDMSEAQREGLGEMLRVHARWPENAFEELVGFRRSFIAPVPGAMAERIGKG